MTMRDRARLSTARRAARSIRGAVEVDMWRRSAEVHELVVDQPHLAHARGHSEQHVTANGIEQLEGLRVGGDEIFRRDAIAGHRGHPRAAQRPGATFAARQKLERGVESMSKSECSPAIAGPET